VSFDDLRKLNKSLDISPLSLTEVSSTEELAQDGRDVGGIVAQRGIETWFNDTANQPVDPSSVPADPFAVPQPSEQTLIRQAQTREMLKNTSFVLGYPSRLIRSAMALSGISARSERFGDIRKSQGFWIAMADLTFTLSPGTPVAVNDDIMNRTLELSQDIPSILTKPSVPEETLPSVGAVVTNVFNTPEGQEWMYDVVGELVIEANVSSAVKRTAHQAMSRFTGAAYDAGEDLVKKKGIKNFLGQMTDEELAAVDDAVNFRQVGVLGTKPAQQEIDDALKRTFQYIKDSGDARITKQEFITAQRRQGAARMHASARKASETGEYGAGMAARMRAAGRTEVSEKAFKPLLEVSESAADDLTTMNKVIANHNFSGKIYTQANTHEALAKLYEYGELLTAGEVELLRDVFGNDFANSLVKFTSKPTGVAGKAFDAGGKILRGLSATSRTMMTTGELSFLLRQANYRAWSRPSEAVRSFAVAARSLFSPQYARHMDDAIRFRKAGKVGVEHGLFLGKFGDDVGMVGREEVFMAEWLHKVPVLGRIVKSFERGYVTGLNQIRVDWFDEGLKIIERTGRSGDDELLSKWATYVNNMTGRADLDNIAAGNKAMKSMAETAKKVMFAPRFTASKWGRHSAAAKLMFGRETPNAMRRMLASDTVAKWRRYERLAHYASLNGYEIEKDPRSADFLKLKIGDTRFDVLGGDVQIQVLLARIVSGETKDTSTGLVKDAAALEIAKRYATGKLNPLWSLAIDKVTGSTFEGEDIDDPKVLAKVIKNKFIPLYLQDIKDKMFSEYETEGITLADAIEGGVSTMVLGFAGAGIQTYAPSARKEYELMVNDKAQELYSKDFADLVPYRKEEVLWEAENDDLDRTDRLKEEMGVARATRKVAANTQKGANKAFRQLRKGLGKDYSLFEDSNIAVREIGRNISDIKLNSDQHKALQDTYAEFIKRGIQAYPALKQLKPDDFIRRQWLQDILDDAREDAKAELFFIQPESTNRQDLGRRADKTRKGQGFLGPLKRPDGTISTEISIGVSFDGKETQIPLIVPTLTPKEMDVLLAIPLDEDFNDVVPQSIVDKAVRHAKKRLKANKSPFAD